MTNQNGRPRVLCVDDDLRTLDIVTRIVSRLPVECISTDQPRQALELARGQAPDLLVLDLMMPGITGWELLARIRHEHPDTPMRVVIVSAKDDAIERTIAKNVARVDLFMGKPFDTDELASSVAQLLDLAGAPAPRVDEGGQS
ncbi:MAG TPA: response regulator [Anaerolineales bacterium]|nr:response regulator [Anaerolineales bacterium]